MTKEQIQKLEESLLKFVEDTVEGRATSENAVTALPGVACALVDLERLISQLVVDFLEKLSQIWEEKNE